MKHFWVRVKRCVCEEGGPTMDVVRSSSGRSIESIDILWAGGVQRILFADQSTALNARVVGDSFLDRNS